jgi:hypothetical protein
MLGGILILILTSFLAHVVINRLKGIHPFIDAVLLKRLYYYHVFLSFVYYLYSLYNASDSRYYYKKVVEDFRGPEWFDFYGTSTTFIEFISYPFIRYLGFSYLAMMALFAFLGYIGFIYFYIFFKERIKFRHHFLGVDLLTLVFFLPNLHFWSGSLGKGAIIFPAIALFFYGISKINQRYIAVAFAAVIIYHVRPHIMLVMLVSCFIGLVFSTKGISWVFRVVFIAGASVAFFYIYQDVLTMVGINEEEVLTQGFDLSRRARELSKATSGIDISNYGLGLQLFTFIYRPLFFDAPGLLGIVVSIENVFYLLFFSFLTVSIALAQVSGNLGIAIRQKSQVMMLLMFVIIMFLDEKRLVQYNRQMTERLRREREAEVLMKQKESVRE